MCERRRKGPDYLDHALSATNLRVAKIKETPCPLPEPRAIVVVHGSATDQCPCERACELEIVKLAATEAFKVLALDDAGPKALDAVVTAIRRAETLYRGFKRLEEKEIEADAALLEDDYLCVGSVGSVRKFDHPISLAKYVMKKTNHVVIVSDGAEYLAEELDDEYKNHGDSSMSEAFRTALEKKIAKAKEKEAEDSKAKEKEAEDSKAKEKEAEDSKDKDKEADDSKDKDQETDDSKDKDKETDDSKDKDTETDDSKDKDTETDDSKDKDTETDDSKDKDTETDDSKETVEEEKPQSNCFGALAYDRKGHRSCGLSVMRTDPSEFGTMSSGTLLGCGFHGTQDGCICLSGDDQTLYSHAPAFAILDGVDDNVDLKASMEKQLSFLSSSTGGKAFGGAAIDAYGSPVIVIEADTFPWAYCKNNTIFFGTAAGEFFCERIHLPKKEVEVPEEKPEKKFMQCD